MDLSLSCFDTTSQSSEEKTYETFTEEELREAKEAWDDWEPIVDKRLFFIDRYHKKGDVFFAGLKSHKYGKGFSKVVRFRKSLLNNQYYFKDNSWGAVTHLSLNSYQWKALSHAEEWIHAVRGIGIDIDTGHDEEAKALAFNNILDLNACGLEVDYVAETYNGFHSVYVPEKPFYAYKDKDHVVFNHTAMRFLRDFKRYMVDTLGGDPSQPGVTMLVATPYLYDPMYIGSGKGINFGKLITVVKDLSKNKRHLKPRNPKKRLEEYRRSRNCKSFTIGVLCYKYKKDRNFAWNLIETESPTLEGSEISTIVKSAFSGNYKNATDLACRAYGLGRNTVDAARNLGIIPSLSREEIRDIRAKHYKAINETKKLETSVKIGKAVEMILNDGLVPSIKLVSKYASISRNTAIQHRGISW